MTSVKELCNTLRPGESISIDRSEEIGEYPGTWAGVSPRIREKLDGNTRTVRWVTYPVTVFGVACISAHSLAKRYPDLEEEVTIGRVVAHLHRNAGSTFLIIRTHVYADVRWYEEGLIDRVEEVKEVKDETEVPGEVEKAKNRVLSKALERGLI